MFGRKIFGFLTGLFLVSSGLSAETVRGVVKDSLTGEPLAFVSIVLEGELRKGGVQGGGITDAKGYFSLPNREGTSFLVASFLGYQTKRVRITGGELTVFLNPVAFELGEVTVKPKRERYSRRDNPAVELARNVIAHKRDNRIEAKEQYRVEVYEKLSLAWDDFRLHLDRGFMKRFAFVRNYLDTSALTGQPILTLSMRETLSEKYYRRAPETSRTFIKAHRQEGVDETIDQNGTLSANMQEIFRPVNIFENDITILLNRFVSPLHSTIGTAYYHFYITDTIVVEGDPCATLAFVPSNSEGYGFTGKMSVTLDGKFSVKKLILNLSRKANVNWVDQLRIEQSFRQAGDTTWVVAEENTYISFFAANLPRIYAHQVRNYDHYDFEPSADSIFALSGDLHILPCAEAQTDTFWRQARPNPLLGKEDILSSLLRELRAVPVFNVLIKTGEILISGYIPTTEDQNRSPFDFGPATTFLSGNSVEGLRFRIGGMTTAQLHPHLFAEGFLAYGTNDRRFKYQTNLTYSFNPKKVHVKESPFHALSFLCEYDIYTLGQDFLYTNKDNLFISPPGVNRDAAKMQYIRKTVLNYEREFPSGFSFKTWLQRSNNEAAGMLYYKPLSDFEQIKAFTTTETGLTLRYAPNESAFNSRRGKNSRLNLSSKDVPILTLSHYVGIKGLFGGKYSYHHTELSAEKRIWFSSFGHVDAKVKAGGIWNTVPFPLLILPNTNQSFTIQPETFNLMRPIEFVADRYVALYATYYLKGWILNRTPVIKWLKLREVVSVNAFWGSLSARNDPNNPRSSGSSGLFHLPEGTHVVGKVPYVEASVGVENIFKCLRLDYYRRLTYLDARQGMSALRKGALRMALRFTF
jgi:hypothetical protein